MKKILTIFLSSSLALASVALAQPDEATPGPKKQAKQEAKQEAKQQAAGQDANAAKGANPDKAAKHAAKADAAAAKQQTGADNPNKDGGKKDAVNATTEPKTGGGKAARKAAKQERKAAAAAPAASAAPAGAGNSTPATAAAQTAPTAKVNAKKLDAQAVQTIKTKYVSFNAQPRPEQVPTVTFNQGYRISGANQWQGPQYDVYRSYQPSMHDQAYYRSTYGSNIQTFGGGAYYYNQGYWYPAWGYDNSAQYYPYDGPIYVGRSAVPVDRVIANVQASLQQMGYYRGEVDGLLGPLTRQALTAYQSDTGLYATAVIDEPTLSSLGLG